jgi:hypothetical protein
LTHYTRRHQAFQQSNCQCEKRAASFLLPTRGNLKPAPTPISAPDIQLVGTQAEDHTHWDALAHGGTIARDSFYRVCAACFVPLGTSDQGTIHTAAVAPVAKPRPGSGDNHGEQCFRAFSPPPDIRTIHTVYALLPRIYATGKACPERDVQPERPDQDHRERHRLPPFADIPSTTLWTAVPVQPLGY